MRIGKKAHVEYQVGVAGSSVAKSETHQRNHQRALAARVKTVSDESPQFVNIEFCGVDYHIRHFADWIHQNALALQSFANGTVMAERMWPASFTVSPQKRFFRCFDENKFSGQTFAMQLPNC